MKEFIINKHLRLKLEDDKTVIYVDNERFVQCKYLLLDVPIVNITSLEDVDSVDDVIGKLDQFSVEKSSFLTPEIEFWGHCSNLQVWFENNYNTRLIHSNLAFPLLRRLTEIGDNQAKKAFKKEIAKRFLEGNETVRKFLHMQSYLDYLNNEEFCSLFYGMKFNSFSEFLRTLSLYSVIDKMTVPEFLGFVDSLNEFEVKNFVVESKESNLENILLAILDTLKDYRHERFSKKTIDKILKKIGLECFDFLFNLVVDKEGYVDLSVLESVVQIKPEVVKNFLINERHKFKFGFKIDTLRDFQHILNPLLFCFRPNELVLFLDKHHKIDFLEKVFPKMRRFKFLNMSEKDNLDMKHYIAAFILEEVGGILFFENIKKLGMFLSDIIINEVIGKNGKINQRIINIIRLIGEDALTRLNNFLDAFSHDMNFRHDF